MTYILYIKWFKEKYPDKVIKTLAQFKFDLCSNKELLGPQPIKCYWIGIRLKEQNDFMKFYNSKFQIEPLKF